jgi:hypothetical protein
MDDAGLLPEDKKPKPIDPTKPASKEMMDLN